MTHPITLLQTKILELLGANVVLTSLIGADGIFDMPPKHKSGAYIVIVRHDVLSRDGDVAPGYDHRIQLRAWVGQANRADALALADQILLSIQGTDLDSPGLKVTNIHHQRTDSLIEQKSGRANATVSLSIFSEPTA